MNSILRTLAAALAIGCPFATLAAPFLPAGFLIPTSKDIALISNSPQGLRPLDECHVPVAVDRIRVFFFGRSNIYVQDPISGNLLDSKGIPVISGFMNSGPLTLSEDLPGPVKRKAQEAEAGLGKDNLGEGIHVEGALVTKSGKVYFWRLYSDTVLALWDEKKKICTPW